MPYMTVKKGEKFCNHKQGADGKPMGDAIHCFDTKDEASAQLRALYANEGKSAPEIEELMKMDMPAYVPWGVTTLADALAAKDAQETAHELSCLVDTFSQVANSIVGQSEQDVKNKKAALASLADELSKMLSDEIASAGDMEKSVEIDKQDGTDRPEGKAVDLEELMYIKSLGKDRVGGYAVLWGNEGRKDLTGEFFTPKTEELTAIYDTVGKLPFLYHHGLDETLKTSVLGVVDMLKADSIGLWYEAQLKMAKEYEEYVKKLFGDGKLKTSTQTFPVARRVNAKTGEIMRWPIVEITATPTPAEYRMQPIEALKSAFQEVGCNDFACLLKKFGAEEIDGQGAEKARLIASLESLRLEADLLDV